MKKNIAFCLAAVFLLFLCLPPKESALARPREDITSPSQLIEAVNSLRLSNGLAALPVHPILMQSAQSQADYMAAIGYSTHARPSGTYTQQLLSLGFPLAGDLSLGGFRAENVLNTNGPLVWGSVPGAWQDAEHMNTMLSGNFTHIGAGVSQSGSSYFYVVDTAAATGSGQQQSSAAAVLTSAPGGSTTGSSGVSQFMVPVTLNTPRPDGNVYHKVQYGQSLWSIAIAYGTTIKNIQALNNLGEASTVYQGQELLVVTGATQAASAPVEVTPTILITSTFPPTVTFVPTATSVGVTHTPTEDAAIAAEVKPASSRVLLVVIIIAAFVGAGMAVWLIRDPGD
ncbi:MAG: LysM peptidoglycan-binding domain-containing protein [Anaerolineales bacterium]|nr:LysM peptidoglycan-binding domain-containing protein [Anaerolineales bacterium]